MKSIRKKPPKIDHVEPKGGIYERSGAKQKRRKLSTDEIREYIRQYPSAKQKEIAVHFGCSQATISLMIKSSGVSYSSKWRSRMLSREQIRQYIEDNPGAKQKEIAIHFGCSQSTISYVARKLGIGNFPRGTSSKITSEQFEKYIHGHPEATQKDIAQYFDCSLATVSQMFKSCGMQYHVKQSQKQFIEQIRSYVNDHPEATLLEIAKHFHRHFSTIDYLIKKAGIEYSSKQRRHLFSKEKLQEYINKHPEKTQNDIAKYFGLSKSTIMHFIKAANIAYSKKTKPRSSYIERLSKYMQKHPHAKQKDLAKHFGCTPSAISHIIKSSGISYSSKSRSGILSREQVQQHIEAFPDATLKEIAQHFGCDRSSVGQFIRSAGIDYIRKTKPKSHLEEPLRQYIKTQPNATQADIAQYFGCSQAAISRIIKASGISYPSKLGPRVLSREELRQYIQENPEAKQEEIARHFGCSVATTRKLIRLLGIDYLRKPRSGILSRGQVQQYIEAFPNATQADIAQHFGCSQAVIGRMIRKYEISYLNKSQKPFSLSSQNPHRSYIGKDSRTVSIDDIYSYIKDHPEATLDEASKYFGSTKDAIRRMVRTAYGAGQGNARKKVSFEILRTCIHSHPSLGIGAVYKILRSSDARKNREIK